MQTDPAEKEFACPKCGGECYRDDVDVGVGIIYGPWGCGSCGWSCDPEYDSSNGPSPAQLLPEHADCYVDPQGSVHKLQPMRNRMAHFGINPQVIDKVFKGPLPRPTLPPYSPRDAEIFEARAKRSEENHEDL